MSAPENTAPEEHTPPTVIVELHYRQRPDSWPDGRRWQPWSWIAKNAGNGERMARSTESYTNRSDCVEAIAQLFGFGRVVVLREAQKDDVVVRTAVQE